LQNPTAVYAKDFAGQVWSIFGFNLPVPIFSVAAILTIAPIAFVTIIEDLGHIFVIGNVTEQDMIKDPGFDRVLLGNGLATAAAALFGGPPSTTYGENIGVLAITKVYSSWVIRIAAVIAILLSFSGVLNALLLSIPVAVMGGISILLFGMIAAAGMRTMIEAKTDLSKTKNLIIVAIILIIGIGSGKVGYATLAGILLNLILPNE
jgi:uracil permease